jgi:BTB/POZ domain
VLSKLANDDNNVDKERLLLDLTPAEALELVDSSRLSDRALQIGDKVWPVHSCLLTRRSDFFKALFTTGFAELHEGIVQVSLPCSEHASVEAVLQYLYAGQTQTAIDDQNVIGVALNAHYLDMPDLYAACAKQLAQCWARLHAIDSTTFSNSVSLALLDDTLAHVPAEAVVSKVKLMATVWGPSINNAMWSDIVRKYVCHADFAAHLTYETLQQLHNNNSITDITKVLDLVPSAVLFNKLGGQVAQLNAQVTSLEEIGSCVRCARRVNRLIAAHDPQGCQQRVHTGKYKKGFDAGWSCCNAVKKRADGCIVNIHDSHVVRCFW